MKSVISIGNQDFVSIRKNHCFYIDKTDFIREWWDKQDSVTLITRPRRFGKTLNMSMTEYFFSVNHADCKRYFEGLSIWEEERFRKLQGTYLSDGLMKNQEMMVTIIAFVTVLVIVYVVRRLEVEYAWHIAVFGGGIAYMIIMAAGGIFLEATIPVVPLVAGTMVSVFVGEILEFFFFHVDYKRTERLQFEDDEYYYYVKAVPKIKDMKKSSGRKPEEVPVDSAVIRNRERE